MKLSRALFLALIAFSVAAPAPWGNDAYAKSKKSSYSTSKVSKAKTTGKKYARKNRGSYAAPKFSALVVDAETGQVLYEQNAASIRYPASLTKMMTLYMTFDALKKGKFSLDQMLPVSAKAASQPQTNIALNKGDEISVRDAVESVVVRSANDSAMVLAEALGETQWNFALMMTNKARQLGMKDTVFRNPNGLPDNQQHTTAYDMARLGIALRRDFPEYYHFFSKQEFAYNGVVYPGHNRVLDRYPGADGLKTGYIRASGFNLVTSVKRDDYKLVAVIMGGSSANSRDNQMMAMLDRTLAQLEDNKSKGLAAYSGFEKKINLSQVEETAGSDSPQVIAMQGY